ncbi:hypothetical protein [Geothrix fuzhouensis]|uniref:hypothetical protein n=1 Tax=Geothrix fuzhouensis TaxID=2966451 RepID=UPI00214924FD|nr:hypothetical protein [Geothrix fuzhouensis]
MSLRGATSVCLGLLSLTGCAPAILTVANMTIPRSLYFHPVKGPILDQYPNTVVAGSASGLTSGSISMKLPTGESCKGEWSPVPQTQSETGLSSDWDLIYGQGYFLKNIQGSRNRVKAKLVGDKGSEILAEFYRHSEHEATLQGVAKDSAGNVYKITN